MAAIRVSELTRLIDGRYGAGVLPEQDGALEIARIMAHHLGALSDPPRRITSWLLERAPWVMGAERERLIGEVTSCPLKWSADKLAWKLRLTDADRTELKIRTIGAIDCSREQRAARRKARRNEMMRILRAKRKQDRVNSI